MTVQDKRTIERALIAATVLLMLFVFGRFLPQASLGQDGGLTELSEGWYRIVDGERVPASLPGVFPAEGEEDLILYHDGLTDQAGQVLTTRGALYRMSILLDGTALYTYDDTRFPRNEQMRTKVDCSASLPDEMEGRTVALVYHSIGASDFVLSSVYAGSGDMVFRFYCGNDVFTLVVVFLMGIMSVIALWVWAYCARNKVRDDRFANVACFLLICAVWCLLDSSLVQYLSGQSPVVCYISFYAFMTLAIPVLHFVRNTGEMGRYRSLDVCMLLFYLNAIAQSLLNAFGVFDFIDMLFVTHLLLVGGIAAAGALMLREYLRKRNREIGTILLAFAVLSLSGLLALLLYWLLGIPYYGAIFECGILVFILILLHGIIVTMVENFRFRTESMVYQRLSREDRLTGLKNRRAFDEFLEQLEARAGAYRDVLLIFMDLDRLKQVNDTFGHNAGDERIIGAAQCIERVFSDAGDCYRIGGDEFCVILPDPEQSVEEWNARLDQELFQYSQTNHCRLSIARGYSYLRDDGGRLKTLSNWKFEADRNMYGDKAARHSQEGPLHEPEI